jgi:hypothetical protein
VKSLYDEADFERELKEIQGESMGWQPLDRGVYLHRGAQAGTPADLVIEVVGLADASLAGLNVLLLT